MLRNECVRTTYTVQDRLPLAVQIIKRPLFPSGHGEALVLVHGTQGNILHAYLDGSSTGSGAMALARSDIKDVTKNFIPELCTLTLSAKEFNELKTRILQGKLTRV